MADTITDLTRTNRLHLTARTYRKTATINALRIDFPFSVRSKEGADFSGKPGDYLAIADDDCDETPHRWIISAADFAAMRDAFTLRPRKGDLYLKLIIDDEKIEMRVEKEKITPRNRVVLTLLLRVRFARVPAQVFHAAQLIADEAIARDWSIWDFVDRVGTLNPPRDVLAFRLYASTVDAPDLVATSHVGGETFAIDMERVFGIDAEIWSRIVALVRAHRVEPLDKFAIQWYDLDDDDESTAPTPKSAVSDV